MISASRAYLEELTKRTRTPIYQVRIYRPPGIIAGLTSLWQLDEASGSRADAIGTNTLLDNNTVTSNPGKVGSAAQFTRANSEYLNCTPGSLRITDNSSFAVWGWVYLDSKPTGSMTIAAQWGNTSPTNSFILQWDQTVDRFRFDIAGPLAQATVYANSFGAPSTATWYFVYAFHDVAAGKIGIWINNSTIDTADDGDVPVLNSIEDFRIGGIVQLSTPVACWNGRIDQVGFSKRVLTSQERSTLYGGGAGLASLDSLVTISETDIARFCTSKPITREPIGQEILQPLMLTRTVDPEHSKCPLSTLTFELIDIRGQASAAVASGLEGLTCQFNAGFWNLEWAVPVNYVTLFTGIVTDIEQDGEVFKVTAQSVMTAANEKLIFNAAQTRLSAAINSSDTTLYVESAVEFDTAASSPDTARRYVVVDQEIITYQGQSSIILGNAIRVGSNPFWVPPPTPNGESVSHSQNAVVRELVALGVLTATNNSNGGTNDLHPIDHLQTILTSKNPKYGIGDVNIPINTANLASVKATLGSDLQAIFMASEPVSAKTFIETEIADLIGAYPIEGTDGSFGLKFYRGADEFAGVAKITDDHVVDPPVWLRNAEQVCNTFVCHYDYNPVVRDYTNKYTYRAEDLIVEHGREIALLHHSKGFRSFFDASTVAPLDTREWFDSTAEFLEAAAKRHIARFGRKVGVISCSTFMDRQLIEVGDDVSGTFSRVLNIANGNRGITNGKFEVIKMQHDFVDNSIRFELLAYPQT